MEQRLLVRDEAIATLDGPIRAQVLNPSMDPLERRDLTDPFTSYDHRLVEHVADRVAIVYLGRIVEGAPTEPLFAAPRHPDTPALLAEAPRLDRRRRDFAPVRGEIPLPLAPAPGCSFHPRCPHATERCRAERPAPEEVGPARAVACHRWREIAPLPAHPAAHNEESARP